MFFKRNRDAAGQNKAVPVNDIPCCLGSETESDGRMVLNAGMHLDGTFRGEILSDDLLIVGDQAHLQAEVVADALIVSGHFVGKIRAVTRVELRATACVTGEIAAPAISIQDGAIFNGTIRMTGQAEIEDEKVAA